MDTFDRFDRSGPSTSPRDEAIKFRLHVDVDLFINVYVNVTSGKIGFALINKNQRIFGRDNQGSTWHLHPVSNPSSHDFGADAVCPVSLHEFVIEVEDMLLHSGLL